MMGSTIFKLLVVEYFAALFVTLLGASILYIVVDLIERLGVILQHDVTVSTVGWYFLYKLPLVVHQTIPAAASIAVVLALIRHRRHREIVALMSAGLSPGRIAQPFLTATTLLCFGNLLFAEFIVPPSTRAAQEINLRDIKKRDRKKIIAEREIWLRGPQGIYHVSYVDRSNQTLLGVTLYEFASDFSLLRIRYFPEVRWTGTEWTVSREQSRVLFSRTEGHGAAAEGEIYLKLPTRFEEFAEVQREPEELSLADLWRQYTTLRSLGLPATRISVEFYLRTALPFAPLVLVLALLPLHIQARQPTQFATSVAASALIGFGYWLMTGAASSLGHAGALPAPVAAWLTNLTYAGAGLAFLIR
ncbi:MAG: LptF/LptG family permease [Candidatus Binatia bacterium]|nr:LptF/LptG family permease [Candidatus Binatia bacterium]